MNNHKYNIHRKRNKTLGVPELIAIALGGMVGGGIFTILGISVSMIGVFTPLAIIVGGLLAMMAAYSYIKLGVYYKDEGATYSFFKKTFPQSRFAAAIIGWFVIFGYISTLSLYAYTFASYAVSGFNFADIELARKVVAGIVILFFTVGSLFIKWGSIIAPVPQPIIAKSIIKAKASQSIKFVDVQLYAPEKFWFLLIHGVPPIHNHLPDG